MREQSTFLLSSRSLVCSRSYSVKPSFHDSQAVLASLIALWTVPMTPAACGFLVIVLEVERTEAFGLAVPRCGRVWTSRSAMMKPWGKDHEMAVSSR